MAPAAASRVGGLGAVLSCLVACGAPEGGAAAAGGFAAPWTAELSPGLDGVTEELLLPAAPGPGHALHLRVAAPPGRCLQIESLRDGPAALVSPPVGRDDFGPVCRRCSERVSVLQGRGRYTLPVGPGPLLLRLGARDCLSLLPIEAPGERWRVSVRFSPPPPAGRATLALRVALAPGAWVRDEPEPQAALGAVLREAEAQLDLSLRLAGIERADAPDPWLLSREDLGAALRDDEPEDALRVLIAGCLLLDEPLTGQRAQPDGVVPRVPGGPVLLRGRACTEGAAPFVWPAAALGKLLAHEIGHGLGLYHSVEADGDEDDLPDTGADNLMHFRPLSAGAEGLSPLQRQVLRRDPRLTFGSP